MAATLANTVGSSATSFNPFVAHVLPEANPAPILPRASLWRNLAGQKRIPRNTMDLPYRIISNRLMKVHHSVASSPYQ
ncbi:hypothetical protein N7449_011372 [Penicillium cf. viridicatum]|uniref:Uncharacterized protein n=1 Tax=Penicillium cf. viridicatum TaxID=2972119 RepID=A0A9W9M2I8_9EURO|nr:hypothetical protein N7449_011372 [Penicillium cf. viridicatum]